MRSSRDRHSMQHDPAGQGSGAAGPQECSGNLRPFGTDNDLLLHEVPGGRAHKSVYESGDAKHDQFSTVSATHGLVQTRVTACPEPFAQALLDSADHTRPLVDKGCVELE